MASRLHRLFDPGNLPHDFRFVDNNWERRYRWSDPDATVTTTSAAVSAAVRVLATLFAPDRFVVDVAWFPWGVAHELGSHRGGRPDAPSGSADAYEEVVREALAATPPPEDGTEVGVCSVAQHDDGWVRIAVPPGADTDPPWTLACEDAVYPRRNRVLPTGPLAGLPTAWVRLDDASSCSSLLVYAEATGHASATLRLGPNLYNPDCDPRPPERLVRGVPLVEWQRCNRAVLDDTERRLHRLGWTVGSS